MITIIKKTTQTILTNVEELKNLPDGTGVQEGGYYENYGFDYSENYDFDYDSEVDLYYRKETDGLKYDSYWHDTSEDLSWDEVEEKIKKENKVFLLSQTEEIVVTDGEK